MRLTGLVGVATVATTMLVTVSGCGDDAGRETTTSSLSEAFALRPAPAEQQEVVGHGVSIVVPADWSASGEEQLDPQGRSYEWAVEAAGSDAGFPPFVNMSMGVPGETSTGYDAAPEALKTVEGIDPGFTVHDEGEIDVPGVDHAYQVHYRRTASHQGSDVEVELVQVFLDMPDDVLSSIRFQAPAGTFDDSDLPAVLDSLAVDVES